MFVQMPARAAILMMASVLLTGCLASTGLTEQETEMKESLNSSSYMPASRTMRDNIETQELFAQAAFWSREYDLNPSDLEATIKLASAVRKLGNPGRAVEITQMSRALYPKDPYLGAEFAAALIANERAADAAPVLDEMLRIAPAYARLWSLKGAALDQMEDYDLARKHYARALQITPHDPNILANIGLSHALAGDAQTAEGWLRRAASMPGAGSAVKQNLALVLRLQGKTEEAEKYARTASKPQRMPTAQPPSAQPMAQRAATPTYRAPSKPKQSASMMRRPASAQIMPQGSVPQTSSVQPQGQQYSSATDAARAAARRATQRNKQEVVSPEKIQAQQALLAQMSAGQNTSPPAAAGYPQYQPQVTAKPNYAYPAPQNREAARRRR